MRTEADWKEIPVENRRLTSLAERRGVATCSAPSPMWCGADIDRLRPHMLRVAAEVLNPTQLAALAAAFAEMNTVEIGRLLGKAQSVVHRTLYGTKRDGEHFGGALARLGAALKRDDGFLGELAAIQAENGALDAGEEVPPPPPDDFWARWYRAAKALDRDDLVVPLTVLLVARSLMSAKHTVRLAQLAECFPEDALEGALEVLQAERWVLCSEGRLEVRWTPADGPLVPVEKLKPVARPSGIGRVMIGSGPKPTGRELRRKRRCTGKRAREDEATNPAPSRAPQSSRSRKTASTKPRAKNARSKPQTRSERSER